MDGVGTHEFQFELDSFNILPLDESNAELKKFYNDLDANDPDPYVHWLRHGDAADAAANRS